MTKQDRQKLSILVVLVGVLALILVLGYRMNQPQTTSAVRPSEPQTSANPPAASDARIRLDLVDRSGETEGTIGKRNLFQYQQAPPPAATSVSARGAAPPIVRNTPPPLTTFPVQSSRPSGPPPIALKYQGFAATRAPQGGFTAFLSDDSRHYNVTVGEVLMGRFRIASISDKSVEVEDLEYNRRQILPLLN